MGCVPIAMSRHLGGDVPRRILFRSGEAFAIPPKLNYFYVAVNTISFKLNLGRETELRARFNEMIVYLSIDH